MDRFEFGDPTLFHNETLLLRGSCVKLYDGDNETMYKNGELVLTSHRLLWGQMGHIQNGLPCLILPLNYIIFIEEHPKSKKLILHLSEANKGNIKGPSNRSSYNHVKISIGDGQKDNFRIMLNQAVQRKAWIEEKVASFSNKNIKLRTGIVGIERGIQEKQKATDQSITEAFQDLDKLMTMAKDMVNITKNISAKIREKQGDITEDETVRFKSYLLSLGIDDPVTRDGFNSDSHYYNSLARQICDILEEPIKEVGGIMSLADVYCRVNRARGLELLSPEDLLNACQVLDKLDLTIRLHQFDSGVLVLQQKSHDNEIIIATTAKFVVDSGSLTAEHLAQEIGISMLLSKERLLTTEKAGLICRDESIEGLRFYPNLFLQT
uniref:Vacuolar protein-sorting-associated protein 36 n=1 Tax=Clastoptera arizonana TaxID=38151 RepID=A0A1B6CPV6_9HEMI